MIGYRALCKRFYAHNNYSIAINDNSTSKGISFRFYLSSNYLPIKSVSHVEICLFN